MPELPSPACSTQIASQQWKLLDGNSNLPDTLRLSLISLFHTADPIFTLKMCIVSNPFSPEPLLSFGLKLFPGGSSYQILAWIFAIAFNLTSCFQSIFNTAIGVF